MQTTTEASVQVTEQQADNQKLRYRTVWRWHFYAGLYVIPFLIMLSVTGILMMLYKPLIEPALYGELVKVEAQQRPYLSWEQQRSSVAELYPEAVIRQLRMPDSLEESTRFTVKTTEGANLQVLVNPYSGEVLGHIRKDDTLYALADNIHGTLLMGKTGDALIELSAGFMLVLIFTGIYLWWPRTGSKLSMLLPDLSKKGRSLWKELHASVGFWLSFILLLFVLSGLSWTGIWGAQIVQPWNSFPAGVFGGAPVSDQTHASLNPGVIEEVPWNLEQTPLPMSGSMAGKPGIPAGTPVNIDSAVRYAEDNGMTDFRVNLPQDETGVYTIIAATMSGDVIDPRNDRAMHLDQYSGNKLADVDFDQYSLMAKAMAIGIPLHMGLWGQLNLIANVIICALLIFVCISGAVLWWKRRPAQSGISAPRRALPVISWKVAAALWLAAAIFVPLLGAAVLVITLFDLLIGKRLMPASA